MLSRFLNGEVAIFTGPNHEHTLDFFKLCQCFGVREEYIRLDPMSVYGSRYTCFRLGPESTDGSRPLLHCYKEWYETHGRIVMDYEELLCALNGRALESPEPPSSDELFAVLDAM